MILYEYVKMLHIISASLVVSSLFYSYQLWRLLRAQGNANTFSVFMRIQKQTLLVIVPFTLIQLATGFTLISQQHGLLSDSWVSTSLLGFMVMISSWLGFIYFLSASQHLDASSNSNENNNSRKRFYDRAQSIMLFLCALALSAMIYVMANRPGLMN